MAGESPEVLNQAIDILRNTFAGNKFNGFEVEPVAVHCESEEIEIDKKLVKRKTFDELEEVNKFYNSKLCSERLKKSNPRISKEAKFIAKHMDKRQHSIYYRKCIAALGDEVCTHCKKNPPRSSSGLINDLPGRSQGALFYGVAPDPEHEGHNKTFLKLVTEKPQIVPDGDLQGSERCQVNL